MYAGWTGTFSALALQGIIPSAQELTIPNILWLAVGFAAFFTAVRMLLKQFLPATPQIGLLSLAATCLFFAVFLSSKPNLHEVLFWYIAMTSYLVPLYLAPLTVVLILSVRSLWAAALLFVLCFILAGFIPYFMTLQISLLGLGALVTFRYRRLCILLLAGLLGAMLGAVVVIVAPGNAMRAAELGQPDLLNAVLNSLIMSVYPLIQAARQVPLGIVALFGLAAIFGYSFGVLPVQKRSARRYILGIIVLITLLSAAAALLPAFYTFSKLPLRSLTTPIWVTLIGVMAFGYVYGVIFRKNQPPLGYLPRRAQVAALILALGFALNGTPIALQAVQRQAAYAAAWDERDAYLRSLSGSTETVRARSFHGAFDLEDLTDDPTYWTNACIASYYNLSAILPDDQPPFVP
jgi:hypothetical protein